MKTMEKKDIVKKIVMSRRLLSKSKLMKETRIDLELLVDIQKKHLQLLNVLSTVKISFISERLAWKKEFESFWETDCQRANEDVFKSNFRMSRRLFYKLCKLLPGLRKRGRKILEAIPLEKRVAIALYALGHPAEYRTIANMFRVGKTTVCEILLKFCDEVWRVLAPIYLKHFPLTIQKIGRLVQEFEALGFPQCMGAIDSCHIEIHPFQEETVDYCNYKGWNSIVLLALVDAKCRFIYVSCGSPGRYNDSQIFQESSLKQYLDQCSLLEEMKKNISGVEVPVLIIGDSAFRLSDKLMKPYPSQVPQSFRQKNFNLTLAKSHRVVENAFGHLKTRFRRLEKGLYCTVRNANAIIVSCCVLHNFLNEYNDTISKKWLQTSELIEVNRSHPEYNVAQKDKSSNSERIRCAISSYFGRQHLQNNQ